MLPELSILSSVLRKSGWICNKEKEDSDYDSDDDEGFEPPDDSDTEILGKGEEMQEELRIGWGGNP